MIDNMLKRFPGGTDFSWAVPVLRRFGFFAS